MGLLRCRTSPGARCKGATKLSTLTFRFLQNGLNVAGRTKNNDLFSGYIHSAWLCEFGAVAACSFRQIERRIHFLQYFFHQM